MSGAELCGRSCERNREDSVRLNLTHMSPSAEPDLCLQLHDEN